MTVIVPDVNQLGILEGNNGWPKITNSSQKLALQQLGKALFFDMQVGGDGVQACASCHFHAGADDRITNQMSPGIKAGDNIHDLPGVGPNGTLNSGHFPLPVSQAAVGGIPDDPNGMTHPVTPVRNGTDVNDVVSSQGVRLGTFAHLSDPSDVNGGRVDTATLADHDDALHDNVGQDNPLGGSQPNSATDGVGFNRDFPGNTTVPDTVRRVEPRNTPTVLNAVYNFRNFWDG